MKRMMIMMAAAMMLCTLAGAQPHFQGKGPKGPHKQMSPAEMAQRRTERMVQEYNLSDAQAEKVRALNEQYAEKLFTFRGHFGPGHGPGPRPEREDVVPEAGPEAGEAPVARLPKGERPKMTPEEKAARKAEMEKARKEMEEARAQREKDQAEYDAALGQIMTKKQFRAYKADQAAMQERAAGPRPPRPVPGFED